MPRTKLTSKFSANARLWAIGLLVAAGAIAEFRAQTKARSGIPEETRQLAPEQKPPQKPGMATGTAQKAQFDPQRRPITAGGLVKTGPIVFEDVAGKAGLAHWRNTTGTPEKKLILEAKGSGVCLLGFDGDGWLDIYLVNGSTFDAIAGKNRSASMQRCFRNNHDGTFTDVTQKAGVANDRWGLGCAAGDYDNDGWPDLYVTNLGGNRLYHNNRNGSFTDVAEKAGVALKSNSPDAVTDYTGATFGDYDGDGRLRSVCIGIHRVRLQPSAGRWFSSSKSLPPASIVQWM